MSGASPPLRLGWLLIRSLSLQIVCLQEVEEEHYHNWFLPNMSSLGIYFTGNLDRKCIKVRFYLHT